MRETVFGTLKAPVQAYSVLTVNKLLQVAITCLPESTVSLVCQSFMWLGNMVNTSNVSGPEHAQLRMVTAVSS